MAIPSDNNSFITLHRKIMQWEWYSDANTMRVFIHLLLLANHKETRWRGEVISRGQVLTGLDQLSRELKLSVKKIRVSIDHLISTGEVANRSTNKYRVITINNYSSYQDKGGAVWQAKGQAEGQSKGNQRAASNNVNNDNKKTLSNEREDTPAKKVFVPPTKQETAEFFRTEGSTIEEAGKFWYHFDANGWRVGGRAPMKCWQSAAKKWILTSKQFGGHNGQRSNGTLKHQQPLSPSDIPGISERIANDPRYA